MDDTPRHDSTEGAFGRERDGVTYRRVPDLIDVWWDSGCMPFAQWHAPHENEARFAERRFHFPTLIVPLRYSLSGVVGQVPEAARRDERGEGEQ